MYDSKALLEDIAEAFGAFLDPVRTVADDPRGLYVLLSRFNWRLEGLLDSQLGPCRDGLRLAAEAAQAAHEACDRDTESEALIDLGPALLAAFESIKALRSGLGDSALIEVETETLEALGLDLAEYLLMCFLAKRAPELVELASILGLVAREAPRELSRMVEGQPVLLRHPVRRPRLRYDLLETLRSDALAALLRNFVDNGTAMPMDPAGFLETGFGSLCRAFRRVAEIGGDALEGASATLDVSGIELRSPRLTLSEGGPVAVPFPMDDPPTVAFQDGALRLLWLPASLPGPQTDLTLFETHGFRVLVPGVAEDQCPGRGLTLSYAGGEVSVKVQGGLRLELPLSAVTSDTGDALGAMVCGTLERIGDGEPSMTLDRLRLGPVRARLGGANGLLIEDAGFELAELVFTRTAVDPSQLRLKTWGKLSLGDGALKAAFSAEYAVATQAFSLTCTGEVQLGDGLRLEPIDAETPVFSMSSTPGEQTVELRGRMRLPSSVGIESVRANGQLRVSVEPGSLPRILSFSATGEMEGDWELPGGVTLMSATAGIAFDGERFTASLGGHARFSGSDILSGEAACELTLSGSPTDPEDIRLDGTIDQVSLHFTEEAEIFGATLGIKLRTKPEPGSPLCELTISDASGGLFARDDAPTAGVPEAFHLALQGFSGSLVVHPGSVSVSVDSGVLLLPECFSDAAAPDHRPRLDLAANDQPLTINWSAPDSLAFSGRFSLMDVGARYPQDDPDADFRAHLAEATLAFSSSALPVLSDAAGYVTFPLPDGENARVDFSGVGWDLRGLPVGSLFLGSDIGIGLGGGFHLSLLAGNEAATFGPGGTGLSVARIPGSPHARFLIRANVRFTFPEAILSDAAGGTVRVEAEGSLAFSSDNATFPEVEIASLGAVGEFWLGGADSGLRLTGTEAHPEGAHVRATGLAHLFNRSLDEAHTFVLNLEGAVQFPDGGPRLELQGGRIVFGSNDLAVPPKFSATGFSFTPGERLIESLPITLTKAGLSWDPDLELSELFELDANGTSKIEITLGAAMQFPMGDTSIMARVDEVKASLVRGVPHVVLDGVGFLLDDIAVGNMSVSGGVYLGGLQGLFQFPPDPSGVFAAGKVGGSISGAGVNGLVAFKLVPPMPLGVSLGLEAGAVGIPLGQTGILLTGASAGISFANSNKSPSDLNTYINLDVEGKPGPLPTDPSGRPMAIPPPDTQTVRASRKLDKPVEAPGCPCDCPPASMNVFCQPHPDQEQFPGRVILKFSSLTEEFLQGLEIPMPTPGGSVEWRNLKAFIQSLPQPDPGHLDELAETLGEALGNGIRDAAFSLWPGGAAEVPAKLQAMLTTTQAAFTARIREGLAAIGSRSLWQLVCDEAYKGLPCPDVTQEITATFSYAGISSFLSITGGVSVSTTGAAGVVGWLNLVGIKVGKLSGFLTITSPTGEIDPALCGQIVCSVGPLELGSVNAALTCQGFLTGLRDAVVASAVGIGKPVIQGILSQVEKSFNSNPLFHSSPELLLGDLTVEQATVYAGVLSRLFLEAGAGGASSLDPAEVRTLFTSLLQTVWERFEPQLVLCGKVGPKLFGMQLGSDLVAIKAWARKGDMGASFSFSPMVLLSGSVLGTAAASLFCGFEQAMLGFTVQFPDPVQMLIDGIGGAFRGPADAEAYAARGFEAILRHSSIVASYKLSPFGLKLVDAGARMVLPDLLRHPAFRDPANPWRRPPDRLPLLGKILLAGKLEDSTWDGKLGDIDPAYSGLWLGSDYFPHGGVIGAARLVMPRALTETPDLDTLRTIVQNGEPLPRLKAALKYLKEYVLQTEEVGTFAFYTPAPNPPGLAYRGRPLTGEDLLRTLTDAEYARAVASEQTTPISPDTSAEAFLQGNLNVRLLGVPLVEALMEFMPASGEAEGHLLITAKAPAGSWPHRLGLDAGFTFKVTQKPPLPMDVWFGTLASALGLPSDGTPLSVGSADAEAMAAIAAVPRRPEDVQILVDRLLQSLIADAGDLSARSLRNGLPAFYPQSTAAEAAEKAELARNLGASLDAVATRLRDLALRVGSSVIPGTPAAEQSAALAGTLARQFATMLVEDMPKVALEAFFRFRIPPEWQTFFKGVGATAAGEAEASLYAYSPGFDPAASGGARAEARRLGGIVVAAGLRFEMAFAGARIAFALPPVEFAVLPPQQEGFATAYPHLQGRIEVPPMDIPLFGASVRLQGPKLVFDSNPPDGLLMTLEGWIPNFTIGRFRIASSSGGPLRVRFELRRQGNDAVSSLWMEPASLSLPALFPATTGVALALHGATQDQGFRVDAAGNLDCGLTVVSDLWVQSPYDPTDPPLLRIHATGVSGTLRKTASGPARLNLAIPASCRVIAFPGQAWEKTFTPPEFTIEAASDGKFRLAVSIPAIQFGALRISGSGTPGNPEPIRARLTQYGFTLDAAYATFNGTGIPSVALRRFVINGNGDMRASARTRSFELPGFLRTSSASIKVRRQDGVAYLLAERPKVTLFPGTAMAAKVDPGGDIRLDSSGTFAIEIQVGTGGKAPMGILNLFTVSGALRFGIAPTSLGSLEPFVHIEDARVEWPGLPGVPGMSATRVSFSPRGVQADLTSPSFGVPGLVDIQTSDWGFKYDLAARTLTLNSGIPSLTLFRIFQCTGSELNLMVTTHAITFQTGRLILVPGLFEIGPGNWTLSGTTLSYRGESRIVSRSFSGLDIRFTLTPLGIRASLDQVIPLVDLADTLSASVPTETFLLKWDEAHRAYSLAAHIRASLLGATVSATADITTSGTVQITWSGNSLFRVGPFLWTTKPGKESHIRFKAADPSYPDLWAHLGVGVLTVSPGFSITGWPVSGPEVNECVLDAAGGFIASLPALTLNGISLSTWNENNYVRLKRHSNSISAEIRQDVSFLGIGMVLLMTIDSTGAVTGELSGSLTLDFGGIYGVIRFGEVVMRYKPDGDYPFSTQIPMSGWTFLLRWKGDGASACVVSPGLDENPKLGPCL